MAVPVVTEKHPQVPILMSESMSPFSTLVFAHLEGCTDECDVAEKMVALLPRRTEMVRFILEQKQGAGDGSIGNT